MALAAAYSSGWALSVFTFSPWAVGLNGRTSPPTTSSFRTSRRHLHESDDVLRAGLPVDHRLPARRNEHRCRRLEQHLQPVLRVQWDRAPHQRQHQPVDRGDIRRVRHADLFADRRQRQFDVQRGHGSNPTVSSTNPQVLGTGSLIDGVVSSAYRTAAPSCRAQRQRCRSRSPPARKGSSLRNRSMTSRSPHSRTHSRPSRRFEQRLHDQQRRRQFELRPADSGAGDLRADAGRSRCDGLHRAAPQGGLKPTPGSRPERSGAAPFPW